MHSSGRMAAPSSSRIEIIRSLQRVGLSNTTVLIDVPF
jgi:hypothetical protein